LNEAEEKEKVEQDNGTKRRRKELTADIHVYTTQREATYGHVPDLLRRFGSSSLQWRSTARGERAP